MNAEDNTFDLWSGDRDWQGATYTVREGRRILKWVYIKDYIGYAYSDCVWVDAISLPATSILVTNEKDSDTNSISAEDINISPNPFNPTTQIEFNMLTNSNIELSVYDMNGRKVSELYKGNARIGKNTFNFNGNSFSSGVYYTVLLVDNMRITNKMLLIK